MSEESEERLGAQPLTEDEIARLPRWAQVALAARCALRVMPATGAAGDFGFWRGDVYRWVDAVEVAALAAMVFAAQGRVRSELMGAARADTADAAGLAKRVVDQTIVSRGANAGAAVQAAASATDVAYFAVIGDAESALRAVPGAVAPAAAIAAGAPSGRATADAVDAVLRAVRWDYGSLLRICPAQPCDTDQAVPATFFERPLWEGVQPPHAWVEVLARWRSALDGLSMLQTWVRYERLLSGKGIEWDEVERLAESWFRTRSAQLKIDSRLEMGLPSEPDSAIHAEPTKALEPEPESRPSPVPPPPPLVKLPQHFLSDEPSVEDHMGHRPIVDALAAFVKTRKTELPLAIGICAPWGSGKSSVMKQLQRELQPGLEDPDQEAKKSPHPTRWQVNWGQLSKEIKRWLNPDSIVAPRATKAEAERRFETVYFNAWRHGEGTRLMACLVDQIMQTVANREDPLNRELFWLRMNLRRLDVHALRKQAHAKALLGTALGWVALSLFPLALVSFGAFALMASWLGMALSATTTLLAGAGCWLLPKLGWVAEKAISFDLAKHIRAPDYASLMGPEAGMEEDLRELLRQLENEGKTLAVFVDDLDRCSPKRVADVVETINVFFGQEEVGKCLFVLGMHRELVATSLQLAHKELVAELGESPYLCEELPFGQRFLEKIVQFLVRLPEPSKEEVDAYVAHLSGGEGAPALATEHLRGLREELQADGDFLNREPEHRQRVVSVLASGLGLELKDAEPIADDLVSGEHARRIAKKFDEGSSEALRVFGAVRVGLRSNPRQYKRFFNALRFLYHFQVFRTRLEPRLEELLDLAKRVALTLEWPELIPAVESDAEAYARLRDAAEQGKLKDVLRELLAKTGLTGAAIADGQMLSNAVAHCLAGGRMESLLLANVD